MNTTTHALKRMLALLAAMATILTLLVLPASAKSADGFQYYVDGPYGDDNPATAVITGHKAAVNGTLTVPAKIAGYEVRQINDAAFADRKDIKKVVISEGINFVGCHAFENCTNLRTLVIADAGIGDSAFAGCTALKKVKITGYNFADCKPEWYWNENGNEALFAADWEWTHYEKDYTVKHSDVKTCTGAILTLTAEYDDAKPGDTYHWYCDEGYLFYPDEDDGWMACSGRTITGQVDDSGEQTVICEVTNRKGDVVWAQEFSIHSQKSLVNFARSTVYNSYVYGVSEYTVNHFRWKFMNMLDKMGFNVYGE